jgi:hypothetical protein
MLLDMDFTLKQFICGGGLKKKKRWFLPDIELAITVLKVSVFRGF